MEKEPTEIVKAVSIKLEWKTINVESTKFSKKCNDLVKMIYFDNGYNTSLSNILNTIGNHIGHDETLVKIRKSTDNKKIIDFVNDNLYKTGYLESITF